MKNAAELMRPETFALGVKLYANRYGWRIRHPRATHPLKQIHQLLSQYHGLQRSMLTQRHMLMGQIATACTAYVNSKGAGKFNSDKVLTVRALAAQAQGRLNHETQKANALAQQINAPTENAQVHGGLKLERAAKPGGIAVVGGDLPRLLQSDLAKGKIDLQWDEVGDLQGNDANNLYAIRKFLKSLSADSIVNAGFKVLEYSDEVSRTQYAVKITPTKLMWLETDVPIDTIECTLGEPPGTGLFAADPDGDFFCRVYDQTHDNRGWFAHSSFLSGSNVLCAGTLKIRYGRLLEICNNSGHYQPGLQHLAEAAQALLDHDYKPRDDSYALFQDFKMEYPASRRSQQATGLYRIPLKLFAESGSQLKNVEDFEVNRLKQGERAYGYVNYKAASARGAQPDSY